jgi:hypothetical protein
MKFYYKLDNLNRFTFLSIEKVDENSIEGWEITEEEYQKITYSLHGIENGVIVKKERTQAEIEAENLHIKKHHRIPELKKLLESSDYKIIKCSEAQLANEEMPYNIQELLAERKAWRNEINSIEFEIAMNGE